MKYVVAAIGAALSLFAISTALAGGENSRQDARYTLGAKQANASTSERFEFDYRNPDDPDGKPPAVRKVVTILPRGARYDASVPESCTASDAELTAKGGGACPPGSAIGGGVVTVDSGAPEPGRFVTADVEFFNNQDDPSGEFIYLNTVRGTGARTVIRADVIRRRTVTEAGMLPGTPPDGGAIDTVDVTVSEVSDKGGNYITTPKLCPDRGFWRTRVRFYYDGGVSQLERTKAPCRD